MWMAENLNVSTFRNGDSIPEVNSADEWIEASKEKMPAWCYYKNDPENGKKYGKLYNWYAVNDPRGLAPNGGWYIPSVADWDTLGNYLNEHGKTKFGALPSGNRHVEEHWIKRGYGTKTKSAGPFPGAIRDKVYDMWWDNKEGDWNVGGQYWTSTDMGANAGSNAHYASSSHNGELTGVGKYIGNGPKRDGRSVRCIKQK